MHVEKKDIEQLAKLAHLRLDEAEYARYGEQLSAILSYVGKLAEVDVRAADAIPHEHANGWREDTAVPCSPETLQAIRAEFPVSAKDMLVVPGVFHRVGGTSESEKGV